MPKFFGTPLITLPTLFSDASSQNVSLTSRGELKTVQLSDNHSSLADEGTYFKACTPATTNGASSGGYSSSPAATLGSLPPKSATLAMVNSSGNPLHNVCIDYIRFMVTSAPSTAASGQRVYYAVTSNPYDRFGTGASTAISLLGVNTSSISTEAPVARLYVASSTVPMTLGDFTGPTQTFHSRGKFKDSGTSSAPSFVAGDIYTLDFGDHAVKGQEYLSANANLFSSATGPMILGPGQFMAVTIWSPAGTATFDIDMGWWER
jgi:hypothetical protein